MFVFVFVHVRMRLGGGEREMDGESLSVLMCAYLIGLKARNASFLC